MSERIDCGRLKDVLPIPDLIEIQTKSYEDFLQLNVPPEKREYKGFQEVFRDIFPPEQSENGCGLEFLSYEVEPPKVSIVDCLKDGGTYQASMYANFRLRLPNQKDTKEERVHIGEMPLMTERGSFVINGAERVIVSQLHRSPGVCFEKTKHASGKDLYSYKIIADHGSWLEVQYDNNDYIYIYLDRKRRRRKFLISTFLRAFGFKNDRELLDAVYRCYFLKQSCVRIERDVNGAARVQPMFGEPPAEITEDEQDMLDEDSKDMPRWLGVRDVPVSELLEIDGDALAHIYTVEPVLDPADASVELVERLASLSEKALNAANEAGVESIAAVDTSGMGDTFIRCIQREHKEFQKMPTPEDARKDIYKRMRPTDQATDSNAKALFSHMFEDVRRYDLGRVGRFRIFKRLFNSPLKDLDYFMSEDEKANREKWDKITLPQLKAAIWNFQQILATANALDTTSDELFDDQYILSRLFSTDDEAFATIVRPGKRDEQILNLTKIELLDFVKRAYLQFLKTEDLEAVEAAGKGCLQAFLSSFMEDARSCVRASCVRMGICSERENSGKPAKNDDAVRKIIDEVLSSVCAMDAVGIQRFMAEDSVRTATRKEAKTRELVQCIVRELVRECAKKAIVQVQDFLKSRRYLTKADIASSTAYLMRLKNECCVTDDIDHLGRRRIRTIGELLQNKCRVGLSRMSTAFREKLNGPDFVGKPASNASIENVSISKILNTKPLIGVIRDFFGRNQLSQFMDQTNALAELTNKRRLSALGPGGLTRDRAGFEVRDVHSSHYGRVCPIETPEGPNIGLISSLALYAKIDRFGFINTPYRKIVNSTVTDKIDYLTADREEDFVIAQANAPHDEAGHLVNPYVLARYKGESGEHEREVVDYIDVSPKQLISAAAGLIPFLEHDDANRALMGSNMQRQAVPLLHAERPIVGTGLEEPVAHYSRATMTSEEDGIVASADAKTIIISKDGKLPDETEYPDSVHTYNLYKFLRSNASTLVNQHPIVKRGDTVRKNQAIADGACTDQGELALGRNVMVAFMSWHGYNYEDAIIISERLVKNDTYSSVHVSLEDVLARDTKLGPEEITRDIPNVGEEALRNLDSEGVVRIGAEVKPGDILVGKITPKTESELAPEERLLKAIFGEKAADVKDTSLVVPGGLSGIVMDVRIDRKVDLSKSKPDKPDSLKNRVRETEAKYKQEHDNILDEMVRMLSDSFLGQKLSCTITRMVAGEPEELIAADRKITKSMLGKLAASFDSYIMRECPEKAKIDEIIKGYRAKLRDNEQCRKEAVALLEQGDGADIGKVRGVKVYIASKRRISVGDKMAGRHGNKGIVSKIVPVEDMPFMADGTPVDIILNPLGVPSRMNIGQVFETHVGWAAKILGMTVATPVFDGIREEQITDMLAKAREIKVKEQGWSIDADGHVHDTEGRNRDDCFVGTDGKVRLYDGRTGEPFTQKIMVGQIYMLKLDHLVANKIHARAVGSYSLVTQQPLGGKAQHGGQRFGEMEVWALEAYGAAYTLQEMLTVKSDDVNGRTKIYDSIMHGDNTLRAGIPESFNVLMREMMSLCLDVNLRHGKGEPTV